ncbi:Sir2 family NAD-dependent protein deacetylase [Phytomonospora sp. NPDC050363]|uniref:SIR2 family NAD-dependent protein deacylase n=1 Tax=Phytomonospora sp. NPDC050363 TaxID=3155642 RepID=UPI00340CC4E8
MTTSAFARLLAAAPAVCVLTGAGISTDSGIPDYRGPQGVWTKDPDAAKYVTLDTYLADPQLRRESWLRRRDHPAWDAEPNAAHAALVALEKRGQLAAIITQNIDGLHQKAGSDPAKVIEIHGTIFGVECMTCRQRTTMRSALDRVAGGEADPACLECGGILKSATISFGQNLDTEVLRASVEAVRAADLLVTIGTSLTVHPAAGLVDVALNAGSRVVICNAEPTPYDAVAHAVVRDPIGEALPSVVAETEIDEQP